MLLRTFCFFIQIDEDELDLVIENQEDLESLLLYIVEEVEINNAMFTIELLMIYEPQTYNLFYTILGINRCFTVSFVDSNGNGITCFILQY